MSRTSRANVAMIIELDVTVVPDDAAMAPFIDVAGELVTEHCTGASGPATPYTDTRLELVERWLAAHFYSCRDPRAKSEGAGSVNVTYDITGGLGFDGTTYGQTAMRLDTNGGLTRLNENTKKGKPNAKVIWLGTEV